MWDYDKLFAEGNIVGFKNEVENRFGVYQITRDERLPIDAQYYNFGKRWNDYKNANLARSVIFIQYIIRLDEHGNVVEKLFNREGDMKPEPEPMPELETGMFVRVEDEGLGYIDTRNNRIVYQHGGYDVLDADEYLLYVIPKIIEVYSENACAFSYCNEDVLIWRDPDYQSYLDSKSN